MKKEGRAVEVILVFTLYIGSFPCAQLPGPVHTAGCDDLMPLSEVVTHHWTSPASWQLAGVRALAWTLPARPDREACAELASVSVFFLLSFEARGRIECSG